MILNGDLKIIGAGEIQNLRIENLAVDPAAPSNGQIWYNTESLKLKYFDGVTVNVLATGVDDSVIQVEIDRIETAAGLNADGSMPSLASTNYLVSAANMIDSLKALDTAIKTTATNASSLVIGQVYVTGVVPTSTGIVGSKVYVANTVPANAIVTEATSDTANIRVTVMAEGGIAFYNPTVTIDGQTVTLSEVANEKRMFSGYVDVVVTEDRVINVVSSTGATTSVSLKRAAAGPVASALTFGALPGAQTEVKSGDVVPVAGAVDNTATYAEIIAGGAATSLVSLSLGAADSAGAGKKTVSGNITVSALSGSQTVSMRARNTLGTYGSNLTSTNSVVLNQTYPTISSVSIAYPSTQAALKGSEVATVSATITQFDTVSYSSSTDLSVANPSAYTVAKSVTRVNGSYVTANNYTISATKSSNGATTVRNASVMIANVAATATISIAGAPTRLISSPTGQDYVVTVTPNQASTSAVDVSASSGTWQGSWTKSGQNWVRTLRIVDTDVDGINTFVLNLTNASGMVGATLTSGASYAVGGFVRKYLTVPAFAREVAIGTSINNAAKTVAKYSGAGANLTYYADTLSHTQGYSFTNGSGVFSATGTHLFISDDVFAGANTSGSLIIELEEVM